MPSQEDNRNKSLNGDEGAQALDIDAVTEMSQEEIEALLMQGAGETYPGRQSQLKADTELGDVFDMLDEMQDSKDEDLQDIQDMLQKSDRNEAIDEKEEEPSHGENPADRLLAEIEGAGEEKAMDSKAQKALEKQRKAEEKARLKEEKAARRQAAKAERQAKKAQKKGRKDSEDKPVIEEPEEAKEFDLLMDKDLLDSIVSDAGNVGRQEKPRKSAADDGGRARGSDMEDGAGWFEEIEEDASDRPVRESSGRDNDSDPGILELDMDEVDALIPDVSALPKEEKEEKKGLMSRLVNMLMEEEPENEDLPLSEENEEIIRDLDAEKAVGKGKKAAKKKAKKPAGKKEKKKKAPKPPKPKKEKKPKEPEPYAGKKITFKKALPVLLLGASVGAVVFIFVNLMEDFSIKRTAAEAFEQKDYQGCYQNLYGRKLGDEEQQMYAQAESVLYIRQMYNKYELFRKEGSEAQALDSLLQTVKDYPVLMAYASQWEVLPEVGETYSRILGILNDRYGVSEAQAEELAAIESNIKYTRAVTALIEGAGGSQSAPWQPAGSEEQPDWGQQPDDTVGESGDGQPEDGQEPGVDVSDLPDVLPEESELDGGNFVDNQ